MAETRYLYNREGATLNTGQTKYVGVPIRADGSIGPQISWLDATSAATITLELTNYDENDAPLAGAAAHKWKDSGVSITGPAASAIGSTLVNVENVRQKRARLKIVATANSKIQVTE